jgi:hypothetical protein
LLRHFDEAGLSVAQVPLEHSRLPLAWHDQRIVLGFA